VSEQYKCPFCKNVFANKEASFICSISKCPTKQNEKIKGTTEAWESRQLGADEEFVEVVKPNVIDEDK